MTMLTRFVLPVCLALMMAATVPAEADDLADFNVAVEAAAVHTRTAIGYLRTGNADLASLEIDRLRKDWSQLVQRFSGHRPKAFDGNNLYGKTLVGISARLVAVDLMLNTGRLDNAREGLEAVRGDLYALRKSAGVVVLADCIYDSNKAAATFMAYDAPGLDWSKSGQAVADSAVAYKDILTRCNGLASEALRNDPEFRRLIDEAQTELAKVKQAAKNHDSAQLHRIVGSLRAIDNLLAFRFG
jgi:hypothetical protein